MTLDFVSTRYRSTDPDTSKVAAKNALSRISDLRRMAIRLAVKAVAGGLTAREASVVTGIDYNETQRRVSECGLRKTNLRRDGCAVWSA